MLTLRDRGWIGLSLLGGSPYIIRYNSGLPIVVYVPEGITGCGVQSRKQE
ncbi:MAG: ecotin family protein [Terrimicrobiaceae bacterium]